MPTKVVLDVNAVYSEMIRNEMTFTSLASEMGVARSTLNRYLKKPDSVQLSQVSRMAEALNQPYVKDLLREVEA